MQKAPREGLFSVPSQAVQALKASFSPDCSEA